MDILFPPKSATSKRRSSSDFKKTNLNSTLRERQIRKLSQEKNSSLIFDTAYIYKPSTHLPVTDMNEISTQLTVLKKNFDKQCSEFTKRDLLIGVLKSELDKIHEVEKKQAIFKEIKLIEIKSLEKDIEKTKSLQDQEDDNREIFFHILDRMRTTLVHLKNKTHGYKHSLHKKSFSLITEKEICNKVKESRVRTAHALTRLKNLACIQKNEEKKEVEELEKNVEKRRIASSNRAERRKKQAEIIEKAMIESQSTKLEEVRERYFLNKLWYSITTLRFQKEQSNSKKFEDAHLRIKLATGIKEIPLFVEKFLTREKTYREMLLSVKEKEAQLNVYKEKIDKMQKEIEKFNSGHTELKIDEGSRIKLNKLHKELRENLVKKAQIMQVYDKVAKWVLRIKNKIVVNETDNIFSTQSVMENRDSLRESFDELKIVVIGILKGLDKGKFREEIKRKEKLKEIIEEIPDVDRGKIRYLSNFDETELVGLETDLALDEIMKKGKKNN
ncbi:hypothetical protein SteCoe_22029 [Stentor coeruleus]|uniref:Uncharacterized protein n=1 Tax=Stentor coeruleus TaxID=5963 RepID=A0A1R2BN94_9CILI|nr:hypothetical protein SteCoe_22029 [Stentor coeruleus]